MITGHRRSHSEKKPCKPLELNSRSIPLTLNLPPHSTDL